MSVGEPCYENIEKDIENVTQIDERVINFLNVVQHAPRDIQVTTDKFLASIDKLKKSYIVNIVKSKKVQRKHNDAERRLALCQREYNFFKCQDDYLNQISPEEYYAADEKLEKAKLERSICYCQLQLAVRELELSKERLCRLSKRSEHLFLSTLRNHSDRAWAEVYKNESQRPKSELKRVSTVPSVVPKPVLKVRGEDTRQGRSRDGSTNYNTMRSSKVSIQSSKDTIRTSKHSMRAGKVLTKSQSLDTGCYSNDEEFPPPPPPLWFEDCEVFENNVGLDVIDRKKRFSDRSAVDEGIGDIDWNPSQVTSEVGSDVNETLETEVLDDIERIPRDDVDFNSSQVTFEDGSDGKVTVDVHETINNNQHTSNNDRIPNIGNTLPNIVKLNDENTPVSEVSGNISSTVALDHISDSPEFIPEFEFTRDVENIQPEVLTTNQIPVYAEVTLHEVKILQNKLNSAEMPANEMYDDNNSFDQNTLHNTRDVSDMTGDDDVISEHFEDMTMTDVEDGYHRKQREERKEHVYEDVPFLPSYKQKKEKMKKKSKFKFLTKVFHGPWEGWEDA